VIDHLAFSVADLDATLARLGAQGVQVTAGPRRLADGQIRYSFVAGPDEIAIEILEDHTQRPAPLPD
jgi:catechol 2,3-dioxygenase-like lactoylglutathione lyase family enzyme